MDRPPLSILIAQLDPKVGEVRGNLSMAKDFVRAHLGANPDLIVFTECFLAGYPIEDLAIHPAFLAEVEKALADFTAFIADIGGPAVVIGAPEEGPDLPYNTAYFIFPDGTKKTARKLDLPNDGVFDEVRNFARGSLRPPIRFKGWRVGLGICEEMWHPEVSAHLASGLADLLLFINGSPYTRGKHLGDRIGHAIARVRETGLPLIYANQVGGQDELVFDGASFGVAAEFRIVNQMPAFETAHGWFTLGEDGLSDGDKAWLAPKKALRYPQADQADYSACVLGLRDYVEKNGFKGVVLGLSGGIDSQLAATMAVDAFGADRVKAITLPSLVTADDSLSDAHVGARALGIEMLEVPIAAAVDEVNSGLRSFGDRLGPIPSEDVTEENVQARLRMVFIMAVSNRYGLLPVTTGNKSEMSTGYATLYGDMAGGFNPLKDLYKTEVWNLARLRNRIRPVGCLGATGAVVPDKIIDKAPTAELRAGQTDEEKLGPYKVLDAILRSLVDDHLGVEATARLIAREMPEAPHKYLSRDHVAFVANLLRVAEYKRRQGAPGVKLGPRAFGRDRRFPITNGFRF